MFKIIICTFINFILLFSTAKAEEQNFTYSGSSAVIASGRLEATDPTYRRLNSNNGDLSGQCAIVVSPSGMAVAYDTVVLHNSSSRIETIQAELITEDCQTKDSILFAYQTGFNPAEPQNYCLLENDDISPVNVCSTINNLSIAPGSNIVFVIAAIKNFRNSNNMPDPAGTFSWALRLGGDVIFKNTFE